MSATTNTGSTTALFSLGNRFGLGRQPIHKACHVHFPFEADLEACLLYGYVYSGPDLFVMARPVDARAHYVNIANPEYNEFTEVNAWWIHCMAGELRRVWEIMPTEPRFPLVGYERKRRVRWFQTNRIWERIDPE